MIDVEIGGDGVKRLEHLSARLKAAGRKDLEAELRKALRAAAEPVKDAIPEGALQSLPRRGGLAAAVASQLGISVSVRGGGRNPNVTVRAKHNYNIRDLNRTGRLRHPTFGHKPWAMQQVDPGFLDRYVAQSAPDARDRVEAALRSFAARMEKEGIT